MFGFDGVISGENKTLLDDASGEIAMKISVEIDCAPTETRQFFGLPNVDRVQQIMVDKIEQRMAEVADHFAPEALMGSWLSLLPQNADWLQKAFAETRVRNTERP